MNRAAFLDRDGVINRIALRDGRPYPPATLAEFELFPQVSEALNLLKKSGYKIIVVTNQPDVRTGVQKKEMVETFHAKLLAELPIDEIYVCYHIDADGCSCRKPKPGMLLDAAEKWSIDLKSSFMVGDRWRDIEAGQAAGCKTILVKNDYEEKKAENPNWTVDSLFEAVQIIAKLP